MADTTTEQVRKSISGLDANGNVVDTYEVVLTVTDKGDLPDDRLLLLSIVDPDNAKGDTFARVATISDFSDITSDRPTAIDQNEDLHRTLTFTFLYTDLATATNAQDVLKARIDELVTDYKAYLATFLASPTAEVTVHPRYDLDTYNALIAIYVEKVAAEAVAETTRDDAQTTYSEAGDTATEAATAVTEAQTALAECNEAKGWYDALYAAMAAPEFYTHAETMRAAAEAYRVATTGTNTPAEDTFLTAQNTFVVKQSQAEAALATALMNQGLFNTKCVTRNSEVTTAQVAKATADNTVATSKTAYLDAQTTYESAQQATEAALAAIVALKPDFDPATDIT